MRYTSASLISAVVGVFILGGAFGTLLPHAPRTAFLAPGANHYQRAQASTVVVEIPGGFGSGVVFHRGKHTFVWTAGHVASHGDDFRVGRIFHSGKAKTGQLVFHARAIWRPANLDVALLEVDAPREAFGDVELAASDDVPGTPIYHVGNFYGPQFDGSVSTGVISQTSVKPEMPDWPWSAVLDQGTFLAVPGSSGGGVFRESDDKVVGILVGGPGVPGISCYVPVREIRAAARAAGIPWATDDYSFEGLNLGPSDADIAKLADLNKLPAPPEPVVVNIEVLPGSKTNAPSKKLLPPKH